MFNENRNCCYNCTKREVGCHGRCNDYKQFKIRQEEIKQVKIQHEQKNQLSSRFEKLIRKKRGEMI